MRQLDAWHPLLLALVPILHLAGANADQVTLSQVLATCGIALVAAAALRFACLAAMRDAYRAALLCASLIVLFYGGYAIEVFARRFAGGARLHSVMQVGVVALAALAAFLLIRRLKGSLDVLVRMSATTTVVVFSMTAVTAIRGADSGPVLDAEPPVPASPPAAPASAEAPDVYYIIADGYARGDVLQKVYGFDNSEFLDALRARGFFISEQSAANYAQTPLSLAATLNMRYLDAEFTAGSANGRVAARNQTFYRLIQQSEVARRFKAHGYEYVLVPTTWGGTDHSPLADIELRYPRSLGEFNTAILETTLARPLLPGMADMHRHAFDSFAMIAADRKATFAFVHLLLPHNPYVFDREGHERTRVPLTIKFAKQNGAWRLKSEYIDQMIYLNGRLLDAIDAILAAPGPRPIIILQSDHGSAATGFTSGRGARAPFPEERLPILSAYLAPEPLRASLGENLSPVNTFRTLLSTLFGENLPPLANHHYYSWYGDRGPPSEVVLGDLAALMGRKH